MPEAHRWKQLGPDGGGGDGAPKLFCRGVLLRKGLSELPSLGDCPRISSSRGVPNGLASFGSRLRGLPREPVLRALPAFSLMAFSSATSAAMCERTRPDSSRAVVSIARGRCVARLRESQNRNQGSSKEPLRSVLSAEYG